MGWERKSNSQKHKGERPKLSISITRSRQFSPQRSFFPLHLTTTIVGVQFAFGQEITRPGSRDLSTARYFYDSLRFSVASSSSIDCPRRSTNDRDDGNIFKITEIVDGEEEW